MIKSTGPQSDYIFKKGDIVICKNNIGRSEFIVDKEYVVIKSFREYSSHNIVVSAENRIYTSAFASRFTTLKIQRKEKLINIEKNGN